MPNKRVGITVFNNITNRARSTSVSDLGGAETEASCEGSEALAAQPPKRVTGPVVWAALGAAATAEGDTGLVGEGDSNV
eukprot:6189292-Pleurochrysis_carterae.AAC.1